MLGEGNGRYVNMGDGGLSRPFHAILRILCRRLDAMSIEAVETVTLFRPVGQAELDLIRESGWRAFPPRLEGQPIFYPVVQQYYAEDIAREWNTKDPRSGFVGYVTRFEARAEFPRRDPVQTLYGGYQEYWIPAEELGEFNENIVGTIQVVAEFRPDGDPAEAC
jgi:hypothetical protein